MNDITIYHNPQCGTSRNALALIRDAGEEPRVILYLETPPTRPELVALIAEMGIPVRELLRQKGTPYDELDLGNPQWSDDELLDFMMQHPILINRPIVKTPIGTRLCRPSETVRELLGNSRLAVLELTDVDLATDPAAASYVKDETVSVTFAREAGQLQSLEGPNRYALGDALIAGSTGSRWSVSRERFDAKYSPVPPTLAGDDGQYRARPVPVLARQIDRAFTAARSAGGDVLRGNAGDWLLQYGPGDHGVADQARFTQVYRRVN